MLDFLKGCLLPGSLIAKHISVLRQPYSSKSEKKPQLSYTVFLFEPSVVDGEAGTDDLDWPVGAVGAQLCPVLSWGRVTGASILLGKRAASTAAPVAIASLWPYCCADRHPSSLLFLSPAQKTHLQFVRERK